MGRDSQHHCLRCLEIVAKLSHGLGKLSDLGLSGLLTSSGLPGRPGMGLTRVSSKESLGTRICRRKLDHLSEQSRLWGGATSGEGVAC